MLITSSIASPIAGLVPGRVQRLEVVPAVVLPGAAERAQGQPLTATALMPGPTDTDFFHRADMGDTNVGQGEKDDPVQVAEQGLDALFASKDKVVAGSWKTRAKGLANKVLPDSLKAKGTAGWRNRAAPTGRRCPTQPHPDRRVSVRGRDTA